MGWMLTCDTLLGTGTAAGFSVALAAAGAGEEGAAPAEATGAFSTPGEGVDCGAGREAGAADGDSGGFAAAAGAPDVGVAAAGVSLRDLRL